MAIICWHMLTCTFIASSPLYFVTALTALFESIAMIVDQHQPVVEKYYGPGKMMSVLERLLQESDRVVKDLIEGWEEERSMKRKVSINNLIRSTLMFIFFSAFRHRCYSKLYCYKSCSAATTYTT